MEWQVVFKAASLPNDHAAKKAMTFGCIVQYLLPFMLNFRVQYPGV